MIVKITYSSSLEEVPTEVAKLLQDLEKELSSLSKNLGSKELRQGTTDVKTVISRLEHCMSSFEALEAKLKDCHAILNGFVGVKEKQQEQQSSTEEEQKLDSQK